MQITQKELAALIKEALTKKSNLKESTDFSKRREVLLKARQASMKFEKDIVSTLEINEPDEMAAEDQKKYLEVMRKMEHDFVSAVNNAMANISKMNLPKKPQEEPMPEPSLTPSIPSQDLPPTMQKI